MKFSSTLFTLLFSQLLLTTTHASLLIDYRGGQPAAALGNAELEGNALGCKIRSAGDAAFIRPEKDPQMGRDALHFHRDSHFRRAEVKALGGQIKPGKTYFIGYEFRLSKQKESLVVFQWKKHDKNAAPKQNIPLYVFFNRSGQLTIEYTIPGSNGSNREVIWTGPLDITRPNKLAWAINTAPNGKGWLEFYVNGQKQTFNGLRSAGKQRLENVWLFTGATSPKFGIYRAEKQGGGKGFCPSGGVFTGKKEQEGADRAFDSWVYRVQISDASLEEVRDASGVEA